MKEYKWCAIDAEGDVGKLGLLGVSFYCDTHSGYITNHDSIRNLIYSFAGNGYTFIAHNAEYDLSVIFSQLGIPMRAVYFNDRFNRGEWRYDENRAHCELWDTLNLAGGIGLLALGKAIGYPKYETPASLTGEDIDQYRWKCEKHNQWECIECYAIRDAEIIYRFMSDLTDTIRGWGVSPQRRLAGLAEKVWRALDAPSSITIGSAIYRTMARQAYRGGRVEAYKYGRIAPLYTADVSSMYPSVMRELLFPNPAMLRYRKRPWSQRWYDQDEGVANVSIHIPNMYVPPLPHHANDELRYYVGTITDTWSIQEIRYAVSIGCSIKRVHWVLSTDQLVQPFVNFIDTLWAMRQAYAGSHDPRELIAKLLMNNLYGRLGMRESLVRKDIWLETGPALIDHQPYNGWHTSDGQLYLTYERKQPHSDVWANVMWAAQITAGARIKLHKYQVLQGDGLVYSDTDSIFSSKPIVGVSEGLGGLRVDGTYKSALIAGPKLYALEDYDGQWFAKGKGVPRKHALEYLRGERVTYGTPITPKAQARKGIKAGTWIDVTRKRQYVPSRRQIHDPAALESEWGFSETSPPVMILDP